MKYVIQFPSILILLPQPMSKPQSWVYFPGPEQRPHQDVVPADRSRPGPHILGITRTSQVNTRDRKATHREKGETVGAVRLVIRVEGSGRGSLLLSRRRGESHRYQRKLPPTAAA